MKIAWFTPFYNNSAIGKYSQAVTEELKKYSSVDLWVPAGEGTLLETSLNIARFTSDNIQTGILHQYDGIIYNLGDHLGFHQAIYEVSTMVKGLVILHDFIMHHFFAGYYLLVIKDQKAYIMQMLQLYGKEGQIAAIDSLENKRKHVWETDEVVQYPFFEKAIENSLGVIVHSRFLAEEVKKTYLGPLGVIYHPFYSNQDIAVEPKIQAFSLPYADKTLMLTVGHVNANKRIDKVIRVLGENRSLASKVNYVVIGPYEEKGEYISQLHSLIEKYNLQDNVKFMGFQPEDVLYAYLSRADICLNLRYPAMEGASWSLVEQLHYGKPVVVTDTGFYSELPDDCVIKINPQKEDQDLAAMMQRLVSNRDFRETTAKKGKLFALDNFTAAKYCQNFLKFIEEARAFRPLLDLTDRVAAELSLMKATENMDTVDVVANEIYKMFKYRKK
jgi:glycosyltransferase involved in cell wall biosynthesis